MKAEGRGRKPAQGELIGSPSSFILLPSWREGGFPAENRDDVQPIRTQRGAGLLHLPPLPHDHFDRHGAGDPRVASSCCHW
jgi:hypothetical protein